MGNNHPSFSSSHGNRCKVIHQDGSIHEFECESSITVAELMLEHPQQGVVELKEPSLVTKRPTLLPADKKLEVNKIYLMVPLKRGKKMAHLTPQEVNHFLLRVKPMSKFVLPLWAKIVGMDEVDQSKIGIEISSDDNDDGGVEGFEEIMKKDCYLSRQFSSGRGWKPSLDTIVEKKNEIRKGSKWVVVASKLGKRFQSMGLVWG